MAESLSDLSETRWFSNHEADVLCCVPLTLAEAIQAIKDALVPDDRRAFELARQALIAKADKHRDRDPELSR
jgi:hypothetical protein